MKQEEALEILRRTDSIILGHFVLSSGNHGNVYINKDALLAHPKEAALICKAIAEEFIDADIEAVIGPSMGAIILSHLVAFYLSQLTGKEVLSVYAEKSGTGGFVIKRGYDKLIKGKRTLVVEDVLTSGESARMTLEVTEQAGGLVIALAAIANRGGVTAQKLGVPRLFSLLDIPLTTYIPCECQLCSDGVPVSTDVGHGKEFLSRQQSPVKRVKR